MGKCPDVFTDCRGEVLRFDKVNVLPAGECQDITEGVHTPPALGGEIDLIRGVVHLCLDARTGFEADNGFSPRRSQLLQIVSHGGVGAFESEAAQFLMEPDHGDIGVTREKGGDVVLKRVEHTLGLPFLDGKSTGAGLFVRVNNPVNARAADAQSLGDPAAGGLSVPHLDDLIPSGFLHRRLTP